MFQQLYSTDDSTLLQGSLTIWMPTEGLRLVASGGPQGGAPAPGLRPKATDCGEPTGTAVDGHETPMAGPMLS